MRPDRTAELLAAGLTLVACSPEEPARDVARSTPGAAVGVSESVPDARKVPAGEPAPIQRPAEEPEPRADPDPQVGVELPAPPVRVPENPPAP